MRALLFAPVLLGLSIASPFPDGIGSRTEEPCAQVSSALQTSTDGVVDAQLALNCLKSVPVDVAGDESQLLGISTFSNFQSTLAYLKNPTPGYVA